MRQLNELKLIDSSSYNKFNMINLNWSVINIIMKMAWMKVKWLSLYQIKLNKYGWTDLK